MKNRFLYILSLLLITTCLLSLTACSELLSGILSALPLETVSQDSEESDESTTKASHTHLYGTWVQESEGHYKVCACGDRVDAGAHTPISCGIAAPTFDASGHSAGTICSSCGYLLSGEETLPAFSETVGDYAYCSLLSHPNGADLQSFYKALYAECVAFHTQSSQDAERIEDRYIALSVSFGDYALSGEDAFLVLHALQADCPIFYWIDSYASTYGNLLRVHTTSEFADGDLRASINEDIYKEIVATALPSEPYLAVLALHDTIVNRMTYAYKADGVTPEDAPYAHSIYGYFAHSAGVCETYTETFSLFLNYYGIENIPVSGVAGGPHAWNLVKMDDGCYYWFDLTWDDQPTHATGRIYDYFCKTDADFGLSSRELYTSIYTYPARGQSSYAPSSPAVESEFASEGFSYQIIGYGEVEMTQASGRSVTVPESVSYDGVTYTVTSIGKLEDNRLEPAFTLGTCSVVIPKTVKYIRGNAFAVATLTDVAVVPENPYLLSEGAAIYTKDTHALLSYLPAVRESGLTLREDTERIASYAILNNSSLSTLVIAKGLTAIDAQAIASCQSLTTIRFGGTCEEWQAIAFGASALPTGITIICTDGNLQS